jgi:DNA repair/transcription protein MET18/MMS19
MDNLKQILVDYISAEKEDVNLVNSIILQAKNVKDNFFDIFDYLNIYIDHENIKFRKNAMKILALLIERLPGVNMTENDLSKLLDLSFVKMADPMTSAPSVKIIFSILILIVDIIERNQQNLNMGSIFDKMLKFFNIEHFNIPNYNQETRSYAIKTLGVFLNYTSEHFFRTKSFDYLQTVLDAIDGEKDPRNILQMFNLIFKINMTFDKTILFPFNKKFFDILDEYYPIEFTPPKNSPEMITAEQLSSKLNDCFCSNEGFAEYLIESIKGILILK